MEKGKVSSITGYESNGIITDIQGRAISFNSSNVVSKDRSGLRAGDQVWFERIGSGINAKAINIRRC